MGQPSAALRFLYRTVPGRFLLKGLTAPWLSKAAGALLSTRLSSSLVGPFVKHNHMDLSDYPERKYRSFNDFFIKNISKQRSDLTRQLVLVFLNVTSEVLHSLIRLFIAVHLGLAPPA